MLVDVVNDISEAKKKLHGVLFIPPPIWAENAPV